MRHAVRAGVWSRVWVLVLGFALIVPMVAGPALAMTGTLQNPAALEAADTSGGHDHAPPGAQEADQCHPGPDCILQAVVAAQIDPQPVWGAGRLTFAPLRQDQTGATDGVVPPPPRAQS